MAEPLRIGIVGLGKMGRIRARTILDNEETVAVVGTDPNRVEDRVLTGMKVVDTHEEVIHSDADAIFVCTPNRFAPDLVCAALDAGKHVFCEKPPGRNLADVERILEAEKRNPHLKLKFGFNHRYHLGIMEAKKIVESERYGRILWVRGVYGKGDSPPNAAGWRNDPSLSGGGILLDQGIHMLDLFRYFCGDFVDVKSMVGTFFWNTELEDNAFALLRDEVGRVAMLHSSFNQWKHLFSLEIYMADGYIHVDGMPSGTRSYRDETITHARRRIGTGSTIGNPPEESAFFNTDPSWELELEEFVECVRRDRPVRNGTSRDAYESMRMVYAIYDADETFRSQAPKAEKAAAANGGKQP